MRRMLAAYFAGALAVTLIWNAPAFAAGTAPAAAAAGEDDAPPDQPAGGMETIIDGKTFEERSAAFVRYCAAARPRNENFPKESMAYYVARLLLNTDTEYALRKLDSAASAVLASAEKKLAANASSEHSYDPFDKHALMNAYLICPAKIPDATVQKIRKYISLYAHREWKGFGSMNYRLMKDGSGFVAAEQWPDMKDVEGLDAAGIKEATSKRLYGYFDAIVKRNLDEYNAPIYYITDLMVVRMLAEFAKDPEMKKRATLTLDWMMVNLACSWNQGYYITTAGRSKYWGSAISCPDGPGATAAVGWFYFGGKRGIGAAHTGPFHAFWMAYPGTHKMPAIINRIAQERSVPFVERESVLSIGKHDIRKYTWQSTSYGLASQWEQAPNPASGLYKETKRQMLKWISDKPVSTFALQQENPRRPYNLKEHVKNAFGYGESPFAQLVQHEGTQIGVYAVPADYEYYKMYVPFVTQGAIVKRMEKDGWVFCHGGSMLFAFKSVKPYTWGKQQEKCDVLWVDQRKNGWVLETSELKPFAGGGVEAELNRFAAAVAEKCRIDASGLEAANPRLLYTSLTGHALEIEYLPHGKPYAGQRKVDGKAIEYKSWPLMGNPWVQQEVDGDILTLKHGGETLVYDFKNWTVTETKQP